MLIYEATRQAIEAAEQATLKTAARYLEEHMGPAVERITGGRYREVQVDDQSLGLPGPGAGDGRPRGRRRSSRRARPTSSSWPPAWASCAS